MPYLFDHFDVISETLALTPVGLFTDVDGTISEMAPTPAEAVVSAVCRESLVFLAGKLALVAAVSGRSAADTRRLVGVDEMVYVGNHGYERWDAGKVTDWPGVEGYPERISSLLDEFGRRVSIDGIVVENKGPTASIHYRRCADHEAARRAILSEVARLAQESGLMVSRGKLVVELRPPLDVTKGSGVLSLIGISFLVLSDTENKIAVNERDDAQVLYVAEAGVEMVKAWFNQPNPDYNPLVPDKSTEVDLCRRKGHTRCLLLPELEKHVSHLL